MSSQPDKRFLIVVLVFGIVGTAASVRWLSDGEIVIRRGEGASASGSRPPPAPRPAGPAAGRIGATTPSSTRSASEWVALGVSMAALSALSFFTGSVTCLKCSAYSCLAVLLSGRLPDGQRSPAGRPLRAPG